MASIIEDLNKAIKNFNDSLSKATQSSVKYSEEYKQYIETTAKDGSVLKQKMKEKVIKVVK